MIELMVLVMLSSGAGVIIGMLGTFWILDRFRRRRERRYVAMILKRKWEQVPEPYHGEKTSNIVPYPDQSRRR